MGRTMIVCVSIMLFTFLMCYALGVADNFLLDFAMSSGSFNFNLDTIFRAGGFAALMAGIGAVILAIAAAYLTIGLIAGFFTKQNYEQIMFAPFIAFLIALNLSMIQVYQAAFFVSPFLALCTIGMFLILSIIAIIDYWRSAAT